VTPLRVIPPSDFRAEVARSIPCDDEACPTVLGGPTNPDLCEDCAGAFEQQGIATSDQQLEIADIQSEDESA
jgi:hypothetical protein